MVQNIDESRKGRENVNFDFERQKRIEHNSKLTTTIDGNLSVTHGLGYDAKKELDGIRAALIKDQEDVKAFNKTAKRGERKQESLIKGRFVINEEVSVATATVTTKDGKTINYLAVSGQSWNPNAPDKVTINGKEYHVLRSEATTTKVINGKNKEIKILPNRPNPDNNQENGNHAEKKIMSHITQQNQNGANIDSIQLNIQNTSRSKQGACYACGGKDGTGGTIQDFKNLNQNIKIHIEHGSTKNSK
ncbi:hypothetical protein M2R47_09025 [Moraxella sp. Tifton1]|uniref:hypothetical protein n=1 Tax=Moraxella oculi TaxID=2940516 RepID=UPI0020125ED8|nr:hypothetical protein [Moraxella sp. Tifton1]MCL1624373.1 hypothetical protein [Moraxella sp. Tifton1]